MAASKSIIATFMITCIIITIIFLCLIYKFHKDDKVGGVIGMSIGACLFSSLASFFGLILA